MTVSKIAVLLPDLRPGGAERMHLDMARIWLEQGIEVDFVVLQKRGSLLSLVPPSAGVIDLASRRVRAAVWPLAAYLGRARPDALLAAMWPLTVLGIVATRMALGRSRVIVSDHNTLSNAYANRGVLHRLALRLSMRMAYPFADCRVAVSQGVAADLSLLSGVDQAKFKVIYNPAASRDGVVRIACRPDEIDPGSKLILAVGTLKFQKNYDLLIEAFARIPKELNVQLCILGEGEMRPELEALVRERSLHGRVILPGFRSNTDAYYQAASLFVLSSRYEGFGNVIVEAMEQGVPVVSTDCPAGPREILSDGKFGRLVPVGDPDALMAAMVEALHDVPDRESLRARARDFSVERIAHEYLNVVLPTLDRGRSEWE